MAVFDLTPSESAAWAGATAAILILLVYVWIALENRKMAKWSRSQVPPRLAGVSPSVAASSNIHVPGARITFCVLATSDDPPAKHDSTYDRDH